MQYSEEVWDYFNQPRNAGSFAIVDKTVGTGQVEATSDGAIIVLQLKLYKLDNSDEIVETKFNAYGCGSTIASASWVSEWSVGKTLQQAEQLHNREIEQALKLAPLKVQCAVLAQQALRAAIADYREKSNQPDD